MANRKMEIDELEFKNELFTVLSYYEDETLINSKTSFFFMDQMIFIWLMF